MSTALAAKAHAHLLARLSEEDGQGTVEYVGLAMAVGVLLLGVTSYLGGSDHGVGSIITGAIKSALHQASGGAK
jgi:hypothetical protein